MQRLSALVLTLLALSMPAHASDEISHFMLENGLELVVIEDHRAPVVVHMVWYRAGAADEKPGVSGVAHFLEHLMFKGTDSVGPGEFSKTVSRNGGRDNAFTSYDFTAYYQRVAADRLELMMKMEADRMIGLRLTPEDVATERDVIIEERNMRIENSPSALFREQKQAAQYLNHPYGIPVIGWRGEMSALERGDALDFYRAYYAPNNAVVVVAGDVEPQAVLTLAEKYYGVLAPNPDLKPRARPQEPRQLAERHLTFSDARVAQPYVSRTYLADERDHEAQEKAAALTILAELLGGGTTSWLTEKLQFESHVAVYSGAFYSGLSLDETTFGLVVVPAANVSLEKAEDAMDDAIAGFLEKGIDDEALERVKLQLRAAWIYGLDDVENRANLYGEALTQGLEVEDVLAWPEVLQSVTKEDIMSAAREVLKREHAVTGWLTSAQKVEMTQ